MKSQDYVSEIWQYKYQKKSYFRTKIKIEEINKQNFVNVQKH